LSDLSIYGQYLYFSFVSTVLQTAIEYLKGVGPQKGEVLRKQLNVHTYEDLLTYFPFRYIDRSVIHTISEINEFSQYIQLRGVVTAIKQIGEGRGKRLTAKFSDRTGNIELVWFQGIDWVLKNIKPNIEYVLFGKPAMFNHNFNIAHPDIEISNGEIEAGAGKGLMPMYNSSETARKRFLDSKGIQRIERVLMDTLVPRDIPEFLPHHILERYNLMGRFSAFQNIHFPKNEEILETAKHRLKFDELFLTQLRLMKMKVLRTTYSKGFIFPKIDNYFKIVYDNLPYKLTGAQQRVLREIRKDTVSGKQMNRLLQGDVGSGKTVVALLTMLMGIDSDFQACIMAPTEILANQHFEGISELLKGSGLHVALLTGNVRAAARRNILANLVEGKLHILIATHALLEDPVVFRNLGIAVIDEQHRFGVAQRAKLWSKNTIPPHVLVMTATPIPRTLAMTTYGDLDVSIIDELPPGRKPIKTVHRTEPRRAAVFGFLKEQIAEGRQIYIVYPLIEESETLDLNNLMEGHEAITRAFPLPQYSVSILYGKMKPADKDYEMQRFVRGETNIMVATTVIEVGVNVPNASVMVIENTERFGLAQLHQLRGRVGRGASQSFCILMTGEKISYVSKRRIEVMCATNDGFVIAEEDMRLRGPGDIDGTRQSGDVNFRIANIATDGVIMEAAREAASDVLESDPSLELPQHATLRSFVQSQSKDNVWSKIS
jgi:ATP-dependent DNA helicase RecG